MGPGVDRSAAADRRASAERLIPLDAPARPRAMAVLDGVLPGRVWTDDGQRPSWTLVVETVDGTVYGGGALTRQVVRDCLTGLETRSSELVFGFAGDEDPLRRCIPAETIYQGEAIDFTDRLPPPDEAAAAEPLPPGARVVPVDRALLPLTLWYDDTVAAYGGLDRWDELGVGFAVMLGDEMAAFATSGPDARGTTELGVATRSEHRRRGFGTIVSRRVARACEARGLSVWWNTNGDNAGSIAIARRLGFRTERRYRLVACRAPLGRGVR